VALGDPTRRGFDPRQRLDEVLLDDQHGVDERHYRADENNTLNDS